MFGQVRFPSISEFQHLLFNQTELKSFLENLMSKSQDKAKASERAERISEKISFYLSSSPLPKEVMVKELREIFLYSSKAFDATGKRLHGKGLFNSLTETLSNDQLVLYDQFMADLGAGMRASSNLFRSEDADKINRDVQFFAYLLAKYTSSMKQQGVELSSSEYTAIVKSTCMGISNFLLHVNDKKNPKEVSFQELAADATKSACSVIDGCKSSYATAGEIGSLLVLEEDINRMVGKRFVSALFKTVENSYKYLRVYWHFIEQMGKPAGFLFADSKASGRQPRDLLERAEWISRQEEQRKNYDKTKKYAKEKWDEQNG